MKIFILSFSLFVAVYASIDDKTSPNAYFIARAFNVAELQQRIQCPFPKNVPCNPTVRYRTFDGTCNNLKSPLLGSIETPYKRFLKPAYNDGFGSPRVKSSSGNDLPNPRKISTTLNSDNLAFERIWTNMFVIFGQFLTHDIALTAKTNSKRLKLNLYRRGSEFIRLPCSYRTKTRTVIRDFSIKNLRALYKKTLTFSLRYCSR